MHFDAPLISGTLIRRYKRFLADVVLQDGQEITVHCPNTGAMLGCDKPGSAVWLSRSSNPKRKYAHTWELVESDGVLVGINTMRANHLVREALDQQLIPELHHLSVIRSEPGNPLGKGRFDFELTDGTATTYLEVKNVTAVATRGTALFPDAVSTRASRHINELRNLLDKGYGAVMVFCVQRSDVEFVRPAREIDPFYAQSLQRAQDAGVGVIAIGASVSPDEIRLERVLKVDVT